MSENKFLAGLKQQFGEKITGGNLDALDPWVEVAAEATVEVSRFLRDDPKLKFDYLNCISAVDYFHTDEKKAQKADWEPHLEIVYHLFSMPFKHSLVIKVMLPRWQNDAEQQLPEMPSVAEVWSTANWHEREIYDLMGVQFTGHPNLRRILCPEDWVGHPLRKDYEMPLEYHGIRGR